MLKNENNVKEIEKWDEVFTLWLKYKAEKKEYYVKTGMGKMMSKLIKLAGGDYSKGLLIIENSMSNNYSGFFELKKEFNKQPEPIRPKNMTAREYLDSQK